ncbi:MAG: phosphatidylglycerophosphatase A [Muribaculaceae bacterium]|nr:phosphatidylglycerophosphatase A [Muribaculaceae bacterium]
MNWKSRWPKPITDKKFPFVPKMLATAFGVGFLPVAPGTWAALLAIILWLPLYLLCDFGVTFWVTIIATVVYCIAGTWASTESEKYWGKDPVVASADEVVGQWIALLPLCSGVDVSPWWLIIVAFALFRLFDIFKPFGIRSLEKLRGGYGMMADDIAAGFLAAIIVMVLNIFV